MASRVHSLATLARQWSSSGLMTAAALTLLVAGCSSGEEDPAPNGSPGEAAAGESAGDDTGDTGDAAGEPEAPARTVTFTEPTETEFQCDCIAMPVGENADGLMAIAKDLRTMDDAEAEPRVAVMDPAGEVLWEKPADDETVSAAPFPQHVATEPAVVVQHQGSLLGYAWEDGERLWSRDNVKVNPEAVEGSDDLVLIAGTLQEDQELTYTVVGLVDTAIGDYRWSGEDLDDYTIDAAEGALYAVRFTEDGSTIIRVDLETGAELVADAPFWQAQFGHGLVVRDGVLVASLGPAGEGEQMAVEVDWNAEEPEAAEVEVPSREQPGVELPDSFVRADSDDEAGLTLAVELDDASGEPKTAAMFDEAGEQLWNAPAADVVSWDEPEDGEDYSFYRADIEYAPEIERAVVVVDRSSGNSYEFGAGADSGGAAYTVLDASTGEELWTWGKRNRASGLDVDDGGVAVVWQAWTGEGQERSAKPLEISVLDLVTGEADWNYTGEPTTAATVSAPQPVADRPARSRLVPRQDESWLLFSRTDSSQG